MIGGVGGILRRGLLEVGDRRRVVVQSKIGFARKVPRLAGRAGAAQLGDAQKGQRLCRLALGEREFAKAQVRFGVERVGLKLGLEFARRGAEVFLPPVDLADQPMRAFKVRVARQSLPCFPDRLIVDALPFEKLGLDEVDAVRVRRDLGDSLVRVLRRFAIGLDEQIVRLYAPFGIVRDADKVGDRRLGPVERHERASHPELSVGEIRFQRERLAEGTGGVSEAVGTIVADAEVERRSPEGRIKLKRLREGWDRGIEPIGEIVHEAEPLQDLRIVRMGDQVVLVELGGGRKVVAELGRVRLGEPVTLFRVSLQCRETPTEKAHGNKNVHCPGERARWSQCPKGRTLRSGKRRVDHLALEAVYHSARVRPMSGSRLRSTCCDRFACDAAAIVVVVMLLCAWGSHAIAALPAAGQELLDPHVAELEQRGEEFLRSRQFDQAIAQFQAALELDPSSAGLHDRLGVVYVGKGDGNRALAEFRESVRLNPRLSDAWSNLGLLLLRTGQAQQALDALRRASQIEPDSAAIHYRLGLALSTGGQAQEAVRDFLAALKLQPDFPEAANDLGAALARLGRSTEAIARFRQALALRPAYPEAHYNLGLAELEGGDAASAIVEFRQAIALRPGYTAARLKLGEALEQVRNWTEAAAEFQAVLAADPSSADGHYNLGRSDLELKRRPDAIAEFQRAIQLDAGFAEAYNNLGVARAEGGKLEEAAGNFQRAAQLKPQYADPHYNLGFVALAQSKPEVAVEEFRKAVELAPANAEYHYRLGLALSEEGKSSEAIEEVRSALRREPANSGAHYLLARLLGLSGDRAGAAREFAEVAKLRQAEQEKDSKETAAILDIGAGLKALSQGRVAQAADDFALATRADPASPEAHNHLGVALAKLGRTREAMAEFRKAIEIEPQNAAARTNVASVLAAQGNIPAAIDELERAIALEGDLAQAHHNLGVLLLEQGDRKAGESELEAARTLGSVRGTAR